LVVSERSLLWSIKTESLFWPIHY